MAAGGVRIMKRLLILRHAKSSWKDERLSDFERPLNKRGQFDAPRMGRLLAQRDLTPQLIISSAAKRARLTAEAVAAASGYTEDIYLTRDLYLASPEEYIDVLSEQGAGHDTVMVVGHNPGIEDLLELLIDYWERMPTAALANVELPIIDWHELTPETQGSLMDLWRPQELH
jgi:phosphohistidine phosphatase